MTKTLKTQDYSLFKLIRKNRAYIRESHLKHLKESILSKNLLEYRPIIVNENYEVLDGQHRLMVAKELNIPIYYQIEDSLEHIDIIRLNVAQAWSFEDYLNYWCEERNQEYLKLREFMKKNELSLKVAMSILIGSKRNAYNDFKAGKFVFLGEEHNKDIEVCHQTIDIIRKFTGDHAFFKTTKFWKALIILVKHQNFNEEQWFKNLPKMVSQITQKISTEEYLASFLYIHNWSLGSKRRISIDDQHIEF